MSDGSVSARVDHVPSAFPGSSRRRRRRVVLPPFVLAVALLSPSAPAFGDPAAQLSASPAATAEPELTPAATPAPTFRSLAACVGDCDGDGQVTIGELLTLVNIALGKAPVSACQNGVPGGTEVTVALILQAVNEALSGCPEKLPVCGNGVVEVGEDCDQGGTCIGNAKAGTSCVRAADCCSTADCSGPRDGGVCTAGLKLGAACTKDSDCPDGACARCQTFGGNGCAANCTAETDLVFDLLAGRVDLNTGVGLLTGTSGCVVSSPVLTLPLPIGNGCLGGSTPGAPCMTDSDCGAGGVCAAASETFRVGRDRGDGIIPLVVKADSVKFPRIDVGGLACACIRGVAQKTCGGTVFEAAAGDRCASTVGTQSTACTEGYGVCDGTKHCANAPCVSCATNTDCEGGALCSKTNGLPCTLVHGAGNSASGIVGCGGAGLPNVDFDDTQDAGGCDDAETCTKPAVKAPCAAVNTCPLTQGPAGSAVILSTTAIGSAVGSCTGSDATVYGSDGRFCTDDDPQASRGTPGTGLLTTGRSCGAITNVCLPPDMSVNISGVCQGAPGAACATDADCAGTGPCVPICATGSPFACTALPDGTFPGGCVADSFVMLGEPTAGDIVVSCQFCAAR